VSRKAILCFPAPPAVLDAALREYRPGRSEPILVGGIAQLKPALRLTMSYRLVIREVEGAEVLTSYTRWLESVQLKEGKNQPVALDVEVSSTER
jgi:hypothetical protein